MALQAISITASEACKDNLKIDISPEDMKNAIFNGHDAGILGTQKTIWTNPMSFHDIIIRAENQDLEGQLKVTNVRPSNLISSVRDDPNKNQIKYHILKFACNSCMRITDVITSGNKYYLKCAHFNQKCNGDVLIETNSKGFQIYHISVIDMKPIHLTRRVSDRSRPSDLKRDGPNMMQQNRLF